MKDFVSALINRHIQTADHVRPRTRGWFDNQAAFDDEPEDENTTVEEQAFTGTMQNRTSVNPHLIFQQTEYRERDVVGEVKSDSPLITSEVPKEERDTPKSLLPIGEIKPLSEDMPLASSEAVVGEERSVKRTALLQQKPSLPQSRSIVEKTEESNPVLRTKHNALPLLEDVTDKLQAGENVEPIIPPIRSMKKNMMPEPEQKAVPHQSIDVTIGRVEIQAVFPAAEKAAPVKNENKGIVTLDDYLDQKRAKP